MSKTATTVVFAEIENHPARDEIIEDLTNRMDAADAAEKYGIGVDVLSGYRKQKIAMEPSLSDKLNTMAENATSPSKPEKPAVAGKVKITPLIERAYRDNRAIRGIRVPGDAKELKDDLQAFADANFQYTLSGPKRSTGLADQGYAHGSKL